MSTPITESCVPELQSSRNQDAEAAGWIRPLASPPQPDPRPACGWRNSNGHQAPRSQIDAPPIARPSEATWKPHCQGRHGIGLIIQAPVTRKTGSKTNQPERKGNAGGQMLAR